MWIWEWFKVAFILPQPFQHDALRDAFQHVELQQSAMIFDYGGTIHYAELENFPKQGTLFGD